MKSVVKLSTILIVGLLIGAIVNQMLYDADFDGVPNFEDTFPRDSSEWNDNDSDGIGDNLDNDDESHLYFDPGDGRLITIFTDEKRKDINKKVSQETGAVHHVAFELSQAVFEQVERRLKERQITYTGPKDRGFMKSIYFRDPLGLLIELAYYTFVIPEGSRLADIMIRAHRIRVNIGAYNIQQEHISEAIEEITSQRDSL